MIFTDDGGMKVITGPVLVGFEDIKKPDKKGKYAIKAMIDKTDTTTVAEIQQLITAEATAHGMTLAPHFSPGHQYNDGDFSKHDHLKGYWLFNAKSGFAPGMVDANGATFDPQFQKFYKGCQVQLVIHVYYFAAKDGGTPGIAIGLDAIRVLDNTRPEFVTAATPDASALFAQGGAAPAGAVVAPAVVAPAVVAPAGAVVAPAAVTPAVVAPAAVTPAVVAPAVVAPAVVAPAVVAPAVVTPAAVAPAVPAAPAGTVMYDAKGQPIAPAYDVLTGGQPV